VSVNDPASGLFVGDTNTQGNRTPGDVVVDNSATEEIEEVEVTEAEETGETSYLATTVARKSILLAIAGLKEVVPMVRETVTWIPTT